jgi:MFS family permease
LTSADPSADLPAATSGIYGATFWLTYGSNLAIMVAICLLYRYADLVLFLGGDEFHLGWIMGTGMVGSLLMRLVMGSAIDHYGTRAVWVTSTVGYVLACLGHLLITRYDTPTIYALRVLYQTSVSGFFGSGSRRSTR